MPERALTLMAVHAHPDDEATGTGGVLAMYAAQGIQTVLVTCTDGGCGDGPGGVKPGEPGHDPAAVVAMRAQELARSAEILGVSHVEALGYADSGMMGWAANEAPHAFWNTPVDEAAARLAALIEQYRPDVVVTYDPNGFYGHPDHIQTHRVAMAAIEQAPIPRKVYWTTVPRSELARFAAIMKEYGADWEEPDSQGASGVDVVEVGLADEEVTTFVDTSDYGQQKFDALQAHASQSENIFFLRMGAQKLTELMGVETFVRVQDSTGASTPEDDLFAGLR